MRRRGRRVGRARGRGASPKTTLRHGQGLFEEPLDDLVQVRRGQTLLRRAPVSAGERVRSARRRGPRARASGDRRGSACAATLPAQRLGDARRPARVPRAASAHSSPRCGQRAPGGAESAAAARRTAAGPPGPAGWLAAPGPRSAGRSWRRTSAAACDRTARSAAAEFNRPRAALDRCRHTHLPLRAVRTQRRCLRAATEAATRGPRNAATARPCAAAALCRRGCPRLVGRCSLDRRSTGALTRALTWRSEACEAEHERATSIDGSRVRTCAPSSKHLHCRLRWRGPWRGIC